MTGAWTVALPLALAALPVAALAQEAPSPVIDTITVRAPVTVRAAGPGQPGRILRDVLARPHVALRPSARLLLPRGLAVPTTVVVLGQDLAIGADVAGDVVVVGGDLFIHPGARITGRAIAIGGGVYGSTLAQVDGATLAFRNVTFDAVEGPAGIVLVYREIGETFEQRIVSLPGIYGVRLPTYDRVNGLSLPVGPLIAFDSAAYTLQPVAVYRSDLGTVDPQLSATARVDRRTEIELWVGRGTFTNDAWIRSDLWNSIISLVSGRDTRNYFRAERAEARIGRAWERDRGLVAAFIGGRGEEASSVGPRPGAVSGPWSVFGRDDREEGMLRANPPILPGRIVSALAGGRAEWETPDGLTVSGAIQVEHALDAPADIRFTQTTVDAALAFPTFRSQRFRFEAHALFTGPEIAPPQRFSYLGGSGTLPTFDLLEFGGDELLFLESRYIVPIEALRLPIVGAPTVMVRHIVGAAGPGQLPDLEQNLGVRLTLFLARVDFTVDPASGEREVSFGVALSR